MRFLLIAILAAALAWAGYWFVGARAIDRDLTAWLEGKDRSGWVSHASSVTTRGFPNRFDTRIEGLELADPVTGWAWTAPFVDFLRLSYQGNHVISVLPTEHVLATPFQRIKIIQGDARASMVFLRDTSFRLDRFTGVSETVELSSTAGWSASAQSVRLATREIERSSNLVEIAFEANDVIPASALLRQAADLDLVPGQISRIQIDGTISFDRPWDLAAIETARPRPRTIELSKAQLVWGPMELWAAGDLEIDRAGLVSGSVTLKVKNWQDLMALAKAAGWVSESMAQPLETGLGFLASLSGSTKTLDAPLTFNKGAASFGPITLGSIPPLRIR